MRLLSSFIACLLLAACAGEEEAVDRGALAAKACENAAKERLEGKTYEVKLKALAASMKPGSDGNMLLSAPLVVEPGLASEVKQVIKCTVRFSPGKPDPDVISFVFDW